MITVLYISSQTAWRGGELQLVYLLDNVCSNPEFQTLVLCPTNSELSKYCNINNISCITFKNCLSSRLKTALSLGKICKVAGVSLIHAQDSHSLGMVAVANMLSINKLPVVAQRRVVFKIKNNFSSKYKYNSKLVKKVICDSNKVKYMVLQILSYPDKACTIYAGIDVEKFFNTHKNNKLHCLLKVDDSVRLVGNVAAITPEKGYFTFVDVASVITQKYDDVIFVIIGDGKDKTAIEKYIAEKNLVGKVLLTGFRDDVHELLPDLDVLLVTSIEEGLGMNILEAFAARTPVTATNAGGIPEIVIDEKTGLLANVGDADKLAEDVVNLLENNTLRDEMVANAAEVVKQHSKNFTVEAVINVYKEILQ